LTFSGSISAWSGPRAERWTRWLVLGGAAALPLQSTATVDIGFTLRVSYVLFGLALVVGLPFAWRGLWLLPPWLRWSAAGLLATYVVVTSTSDLATIAGTSRGGDLRALVYLTDLAIGAGLMCVAAGLWRGFGSLQPLFVALTIGAGAAAAYAVYQWPAQRYGLPVSDILTTRDSNGITTEGFQGTGLLGWERARGTFLEPHFLGAFMSAAAPVAVLAAVQARARMRVVALVAAALVIVALVVSSSAPAYASFAVAGIIAGTTWAVGAGRPRLAGLTAAGAAAAILAAPSLVLVPEVLASATGRDAATLTVTADFRKDAWQRVLDIWSLEPAGGHGAGQSSVRLALASDRPGAVGLSSAQGIWASALIDVGLVGLGFWIALVGGALAHVFRGTYRQPWLASAMLVMATVAAVSSALVASDRLDLRVWLLFGIVAASYYPAPRPSSQSFL